jgi:hypothetical protein
LPPTSSARLAATGREGWLRQVFQRWVRDTARRVPAAGWQSG